MTNLSPAALAIWQQYCGIVEEHGPARLGLAAALRAAVAHTQQHRGHDVWECDADELLAIAAELEAQ